MCSKHVIFKSIDITTEHQVWASTLAGAEDTPRPRVSQAQRKQPPSPHSKSLLAEWGLPWQIEALADEKVAPEVSQDVQRILFPAMQEPLATHALEEGRESEAVDLSSSMIAYGADWCFGRGQNELSGLAHSDAGIVRHCY